MLKKVSQKRLEEIISTINLNVIKEITVTPNGCQYGEVSWFDVNIGSNTYQVWVADLDTWYTHEGIRLFMNMLKGIDEINVIFNEVDFYPLY